METQPPGTVSVPGIDLGHYLAKIVNFFSGNADGAYEAMKSLIGVIAGISIPLSLFLGIAIVIVVENIKKIRKLEELRYETPAEPAYRVEEGADAEVGKRWRMVIEHVNSNNPNDWKQAIIEADVLLDNLVTKLGYRGESLGEKLKRTVKGDFKTRDAAWDAHMVRNRIAHDGSAFEINQHEAKRVIGLYRQVFDEFYHISS